MFWVSMLATLVDVRTVRVEDSRYRASRKSRIAKTDVKNRGGGRWFFSGTYRISERFFRCFHRTFYAIKIRAASNSTKFGGVKEIVEIGNCRALVLFVG